jgi:hypothetical protein
MDVTLLTPVYMRQSAGGIILCLTHIVKSGRLHYGLLQASHSR